MSIEFISQSGSYHYLFGQILGHERCLISSNKPLFQGSMIVNNFTIEFFEFFICLFTVG